jgi:Secretion system C-terminal sorting domain/Cytochrome c554 and c-prime
MSYTKSIILLFFIVFLWAVDGQNAENSIKGTVSNGLNPIDSARVRIQGKNNFVFSDSLGRFEIFTTEPPGRFLSISAGKQGWYNNDRNTQVGDTALQIPLEKLPEGDDWNYKFAAPEYCNTCHQPLYNQWTQSKHSNAAKNPMVLQLLNGTDVHGNTNVAPGFKLDYPFKGGDCADCHAPAAAQWNPGDTDLNDVLWLAEVDTNGVFCDFCHKISHVEVNYERGINGSITLKRPSAELKKDINFGSLDDVTTFWMGATYNPVHSKSDLCSSCHQYANDLGIVVDDTYDSWRESIYAEAGIQCQDCHMKPFSDSTFVSGIGIVDAVKRDPQRLYNHYFRKYGTSDSAETASMQVDQLLSGDTLSVSVNITNEKAGHNLPTGVSLRNIILVLKIENDGENFQLISGDTLPHFAGVGDVKKGNYSGLPGKAFALVTYNANRNEWPSGNWAATGIYMDTRIPAAATDSSSYKLLINPAKGLSLKVELLYRAAYKHWANAKGWDIREYVMADTFLAIIPTSVDQDNAHPELFSLQQNYPNPFNPQTTIRYTVGSVRTLHAVSQQVNLSIYNLLGQKVATLVDKMQTPGNYQVTFDATSLSSGIYFYHLWTSSGYNQSRKMVLLK